MIKPILTGVLILVGASFLPVHGEPVVAPLAAGALSSHDESFAKEASQANKAEIIQGQLANQKATTDGLRTYAQEIITDHTKAGQQLADLAQSKGLTLPGAVSTKQQKEIDHLSGLSGPEFDRAYIHAAVRDHQKVIALFERESNKGQDADLKGFAAQTLPTLQHHLAMAKTLESQLSGTVTNR